MFALVGFMGSGKTTISKLLSEKLAVDAISLDEEIEKKLNMKIRDIFQEFGEKYFREKESEILLEISKKQNIILDLGGGTFIGDANRNILKDAKTIFLNAPFEVLCERLENERFKRPLLADDNWKLNASNLYGKRMEFYKKAKIIIDINGNDSPNDVLEKILKRI